MFLLDWQGLQRMSELQHVMKIWLAVHIDIFVNCNWVVTWWQ